MTDTINTIIHLAGTLGGVCFLAWLAAAGRNPR